MVAKDNADSVEQIFLAIDSIKKNILHEACLRGSSSVLEFLITKKIVNKRNINKRMNIGEYKKVTALELAAVQDKVTRSALMKLLISAGANSNTNLDVFKDCEEIYPSM